MKLIGSGRTAALAIFMISLVQSACGPVPEETSGANPQSAALSSQASALPGATLSAFDVALVVNNEPRTESVEISADALQALGTLRQAGADAQKSTGDERAQSIVQNRIQQLLDEGKFPAAEGANLHISVKLHTQLGKASETTEGVEPCLVPATFYTEYFYVANGGTPECYFYVARDYYDGFYNQCDGSVYLTSYLYSTLDGPYSCGG